MNQAMNRQAAARGGAAVATSPDEIEEGDEGREGEGPPPNARRVRAYAVSRAGNASPAASVRAAASTPEKELEARIDGWGLRNFRGAEFTPFWSKTRDGVRNSVPPRELWDAIARTLAVLQRLRTEVAAPITLTSTYRSTSYNAAIGGEPNSYHTKFLAIDFTCSAGDPATWGATLRGYRGKRFTDPSTGRTFTFRGGVGVYSSRSFVHLDTRGFDSDWQG